MNEQLSNALAIWRNLWDDSMDLATHARAFMAGGLNAAAKARAHLRTSLTKYHLDESMIEDRFMDRLQQLLADGQRRILGLAGAPGAGKSTLAQAILDAFPGRAVVVPMDGYHLANMELQRLGRASRKGAEDTFDSAGFVSLLGRIRAQREGEIIYAPAFRREIEEPIAGAIPVTADVPLVITEGNYLLLQRGHWNEVRPLLDEAWYVDVDPALRVQRLVARHVHFGRSEDAAKTWVQQTDEVNAALIELTRPRADLVFEWPV